MLPSAGACASLGVSRRRGHAPEDGSMAPEISTVPSVGIGEECPFSGGISVHGR